jgi:ketosteroid isomerase-like protein
MLEDALALFVSLQFTWSLESLLDPHRTLAHWTLEHRFVAGGSYVNQGVAIFDVRHGRIAEFTEHFDTAAWLNAFAE